MNTAKHWIKQLADICSAKGVKHAVLSPGSRCAPLVIAFARHPEIQCYNIIDERSAGFYALGIAQQTKQPVALICTSGSAVLNYGPALAEAYYQQLPLIAITADRPSEYIDQGEGQAMRQRNVFANYVKDSFSLPNNVTDADDTWHSARMVNKALNTATRSPFGPVHVNVPLKEPLYNQQDYHTPERLQLVDMPETAPHLPQEQLETLLDTWNTANSHMILVGPTVPEEGLSKALRHLAADDSVAILTEATANLANDEFITAIDPVMDHIEKDALPDHRPELLITFGGNLLSKKLKVFLRKNPPKHHWHIHPGGYFPDTYKSLSKGITALSLHFFQWLANAHTPRISQFGPSWKKAKLKARERHEQIIRDAEWSDMKAFSNIIPALPNGSQLQLGNSTPVRYASLFEFSHERYITLFANRGVSGIDGSISTAAGAALLTDKLVVCIIGDLSFFYDSNALWNNHLPSNLRIIVINNGGGNIFRIINGPSELQELEQYFETPHPGNIEQVVKGFGVDYLEANDEAGLKAVLPQLFEPQAEKSVVLEVRTPNAISADILKNYLNINNQL